MASLVFDATQVKPAAPREPLPDGWYPIIINDSEVKPASTGKGIRLELKMKVVDDHPHYGGQSIFDGLNIQHENPVAQNIAQEQLSAICHALGVLQIQDTSQLHNQVLLVKVVYEPKRTVEVVNAVSQQKETKTFDARNQVKGYAKIGTQEINMSPPPKPLNLTGGAAPAVAAAAPGWANTAPAAAAPVGVAPAAAPAAATGAPSWGQPTAAPAAAAPAAATPSWAGGGATAAPAAQPVAAAAPAGEPAAQPAPAGTPSWARPQA